jgi:hypothetical protein
MQNNMQKMHIPHFWYQKIVKYEKNAKYFFLTPAYQQQVGLELKSKTGRILPKMLNMPNMA